MKLLNILSPIVALFLAGAMAAGMSGAASATDRWSGARDTDAPALTIVGVPKTTDKPFTVTFAFSERVLGFDRSAVTATNAMLSHFSGSGKNYRVKVKPIGRRDVRITVTAHSAEDMAGNTGPISDVSATASGPPKKPARSDNAQEWRQTLNIMERVKTLDDDPDASTLRKREAGNIKTGDAELLVTPPRITREDEKLDMFEQDEAPQP